MRPRQSWQPGRDIPCLRAATYVLRVHDASVLHLSGALGALQSVSLSHTLQEKLLNAPRSCTRAHVCACTVEFVCFLVDYSLALVSAYLAD
jgi:hypothetical protein